MKCAKYCKKCTYDKGLAGGRGTTAWPRPLKQLPLPAPGETFCLDSYSDYTIKILVKLCKFKI